MDLIHEFCFKHQTLRPAGDPCAKCAAEASAQERRDTSNMHEARIADLEQRLLRTNRIVVELVKRFESMRRAHNALAQASERLETQGEQARAALERRVAAHRALLVYVESNDRRLAQVEQWQRNHSTTVEGDLGQRFIVACALCGFYEVRSEPCSYPHCPHCGAPRVEELP